jgi:hypothetical protein
MVAIITAWIAPGITTQDVLTLLTAATMGKIAVASEEAWAEHNVAPLASTVLGILVGAIGTWVAAGYLSIIQTAAIFGGALTYLVPGLGEARAATGMVVTTFMLASYFTSMVTDWNTYNSQP